MIIVLFLVCLVALTILLMPWIRKIVSRMRLVADAEFLDVDLISPLKCSSPEEAGEILISELLRKLREKKQLNYYRLTNLLQNFRQNCNPEILETKKAIEIIEKRFILRPVFGFSLYGNKVIFIDLIPERDINFLKPHISGFTEWHDEYKRIADLSKRYSVLI